MLLTVERAAAERVGHYGSSLWFYAYESPAYGVL